MKPNISSSFRYFLAISSDWHMMPILHKSLTDLENSIKAQYQDAAFSQPELTEEETRSILVFYYQASAVCWVIQERPNLTIESGCYNQMITQALEIKENSEGRS